MRIAVSVESTCDLTKKLLEKYDIKVIPYEIVLGNKTFKDGDISATELFEEVERENALPKTNALNEYEYTEFFESLKKDVRYCDEMKDLNYKIFLEEQGDTNIDVLEILGYEDIYSHARSRGADCVAQFLKNNSDFSENEKIWVILNTCPSLSLYDSKWLLGIKNRAK
jgi:hypothetical protein